jgi:hypothetical protein
MDGTVNNNYEFVVEINLCIEDRFMQYWYPGENTCPRIS